MMLLGHSRAARFVLIFAVLIVLAATLSPQYGPEPVTAGLCLLCGARGLADAILNVFLFVPLGVGLALTDWPERRLYVAAALFSASIELSQLLIAGRDASLGDVIFNTAGAGFGILAVRTARYWFRPDRSVSRRLSLTATIGALAVVSVSGYLMQHSLPSSTYYGQWTPRLGHLESYRGRVLSASLGPLAIPPYRLPDSGAIRSRLLLGDTLKVLAVAGPPPTGLASLLSIYDEKQREVILLGPDRDDLVFRYRTLARSLLLEQPDIRLTDALRVVRPGDTLELRLWRSDDAYCISHRTATTCGLGYPPGRGWGLLAPAALTPDWAIRLLDLIWIGALAFMPGFWARDRVGVAASAGVLVSGILIIPALTAFLPVTMAELLSLCAGFSLGAGVGGLAKAGST